MPDLTFAIEKARSRAVRGRAGHRLPPARDECARGKPFRASLFAARS